MRNTQPERMYNSITAMGFWAMFTFQQLDNTEAQSFYENIVY